MTKPVPLAQVFDLDRITKLCGVRAFAKASMVCEKCNCSRNGRFGPRTARGRRGFFESPGRRLAATVTSRWRAKPVDFVAETSHHRRPMARTYTAEPRLQGSSPSSFGALACLPEHLLDQEKNPERRDGDFAGDPVERW